MDDKTRKRVYAWLEGNYDSETKKEIRDLMENDPEMLSDAFYKDLEFGTGGMRGLMGAGTNRMNIYTVAMATQGLCNYMLKYFGGDSPLKVCIAYDCRRNNRLYAEKAAHVFSANGIRVFVFDAMAPTPELSFALRYLQCQSGIVITASHNPKEYNGYKVYWDDGAQLVPPHDNNVIQEVRNITRIEDVKSKAVPELIESIGEDIDRAFLDEVRKKSLFHAGEADKSIKIVFTPLHGTASRLIPKALKENGFDHVFPVEEQMQEDPDFSTVVSPNPEDSIALEMALDKARKTDADVVMASDPDADRIGLAVKDHSGSYVLLNGNQTGALLIYYLLDHRKQRGLLGNRDYIVKTIVTSELIKDIADSFGVKTYDVLTGFKWIAALIREKEGSENFIAGLEESFGYMIGDFVRDKDSVTAAVILADIAAYAKKEGKSLFDYLMDIYKKYGYYKESLVSVYKHGKSGAEKIAAMMDRFRNFEADTIAGSKITQIRDYLNGNIYDKRNNTRGSMDLPTSNVLQFFTENGSKISLRPSGTEPKIKFYFSVKKSIDTTADIGKMDLLAGDEIRQIKREFELD
jgi:phosphoglucomutase